MNAAEFWGNYWKVYGAQSAAAVRLGLRYLGRFAEAVQPVHKT